MLNSAGSGSFSNVISALDWIVANKATYGIEAANLSLGADGCNNGTDLTSQAIQRAVAAGIVVAVAAGNAGPGTCTVGTPGAAPAALTVGAMADPGPGGFYLASFSSRGPTADGRIKPDVVAPGYSVTSVAANTTQRLRDLQRHEHGDAVRRRRLAADARREPVADAAADQGHDDVDRRGLGPAGPRHRLRRRPARRLRRAARDRRAARLDRRGGADAHVPQRLARPATGASTDITLNVTDTQYPIAATMIESSVTAATSSTPNFNLALLSPSGTQVASATTSSRQDALSYRPTTTGNYVLRISSASGSGPYFVDISAGTGAARSAASAAASSASAAASASSAPAAAASAAAAAPTTAAGAAPTLDSADGAAPGSASTLDVERTGLDTAASAITGYRAVSRLREPLAPRRRERRPDGLSRYAQSRSARPARRRLTIRYNVSRRRAAARQGGQLGTSGLADAASRTGDLLLQGRRRNAVGESGLLERALGDAGRAADYVRAVEAGRHDELVAGTNQMGIDWDASTDNVGVTGYDVYRGGVFVGT